jgi:hypothetical protein
MLKSKSKTSSRVLIITSSGGLGHLQAAKAKEQEILAQEASAFIHIQDIFNDFVGKTVGTFFTSLWNKAKTRAQLSTLKALIHMQPFAEAVLYLPILYKLKRLIETYNINTVIDTQNMGQEPILKIIEQMNKNREQKISYTKILTDLPTENSIHYFSPIKKLAKHKKKDLHIISTKPLLKGSMSEEQFWDSTCGLTKENITYDTFPLRAAFKQNKEQFSNQSINLTLNMHSQGLCELACKALSFGSIHFIQKKHLLNIHIAKEVKLTLVMLGGYPNEQTLLGYIKQFMLHTKKDKHLLCLFCNFGLKDSNSLIQKICNLIESTPKHPKNLSILPMAYQDDTVIMPLIARANGAISRAGGITSMELLTSFSGSLWIHLETKIKKNLARCMPIWERGNAHYLQEKLGAKYITPSTFSKITLGYFN